MSKLKTVNIKGKEYVEVNERVRYFKDKFPNFKLETELIKFNEEQCVVKAIVRNIEGEIVATGLAYEDKNSTFINKTSYLENCETSAVGRALGFLGIGIDGAICSAEEVQNAINNQNTSESSKIDRDATKSSTNTKTPKSDKNAVRAKILSLTDIVNKKSIPSSDITALINKYYKKSAAKQLTMEELDDLISKVEAL